MAPYLILNDSDGNRTRVTAVKGRCLNRLTTEPIFQKHLFKCFQTPQVGLEPTTTRLTAECSTDWAIEDYKGYVPSKPHTRNLHPLPLNRLGYALDRLVTVSSIHYCTSTSVLSTLSSSRGLTTCVGISHLEGGFTLRCLQRLSRPGLATLP